MEAINLTGISETTAVGLIGDRNSREQPEPEKRKKKKRSKPDLLNPNDEIILSSNAENLTISQATNSNNEPKSSGVREPHIDIAV